MAIIWTYAPFFKHNSEYEDFVLWFQAEESIKTEWVAIEVFEDRLYINGVNGKMSNYENIEKFRKNKRSGHWYAKIAIFENQEEKVKFILKWA